MTFEYTDKQYEISLPELVLMKFHLMKVISLPGVSCPFVNINTMFRDIRFTNFGSFIFESSKLHSDEGHF